MPEIPTGQKNSRTGICNHWCVKLTAFQATARGDECFPSEFSLLRLSRLADDSGVRQYPLGRED